MRSIVRSVGMVTALVALIGLYTASCKQRNQDALLRAAQEGEQKSPPDGLKSWANGQEIKNWQQERQIRQKVVYDYLNYDGSDSASKYGFREGQNPKLAWKWFEDSPIGFGGMPFVVLKTLLNLDESYCSDRKERTYRLCKLYKIWHRDSTDSGPRNIDHLGIGPHPDDFEGSGYPLGGERLKPANNRRWPLPYGLVIQGGRPGYDYNVTPFEEDIDVLKNSSYATLFKGKYELEQAIYRNAFKVAFPGVDPMTLDKGQRHKIQYKALGLTLNGFRVALKGVKVGLRKGWKHIAEIIEGLEEDDPVFNKDDRPDYEKFYNDDYTAFGRPTGFDRVFFSCAACHVGRVKVGNKIVYLPGAPNTEIEAQYYSKLLMETGVALADSRIRIESPNLILPRGQIGPKIGPAMGLAMVLLETAGDPKKLSNLYGPSPQQLLRGRVMILRSVINITRILKDIVGTAVKTHYIYYSSAKQNSYNVEKLTKLNLLEPGQKIPDVLENRLGQMDAFGIASGLAALHVIRADNSFLKFLLADKPFDLFGPNDKHEVFGGFAYFPKDSWLGRGPEASETSDDKIKFIRNEVVRGRSKWLPPVPAPIDVKSLFMSKDRYYANWDGNQGAEARTLASGTSATGDPRKVNVQIHEPQNPFINNLPASPYPFQINIEKARLGREHFNQECVSCHFPNNSEIYSNKLMDLNRAKVNTSVSRTLLAGLVLEACAIYHNNVLDPHPPHDYYSGNKNDPNYKDGANNCAPPQNASQGEKLNNYFQDTPGRVVNLNLPPEERQGRAEGKRAGYKADVLHGIWSQSPYLHNGSVPTLGHLICNIRPTKFIRGNIAFDDELVGYEWQKAGKRHDPGDIYLVKEYDTAVFSRANRGHIHGENLCPESLKDLDPNSKKDRDKIAQQIKNSPAGDLIEYLKTL